MGSLYETPVIAPGADRSIRDIDRAIATLASGLRDRFACISARHPDTSSSIEELCAVLDRDLYPALRASLIDCLTEVISDSASQSARASQESFLSDSAPLRQRSKIIAEHSVSAPVYRRGSSYR